jgi:UDP-N-acetylglucosamine 2-epimerase (non-hydrolysing)
MKNFAEIMVIFGTRPEAIKVAPVIKELESRDKVNVIKVATSQHREMLDQVFELFEIVPDFDLKIMKANQTLTYIVEKSMAGLHEVFAQTKPDIILVQGDTTSAFAGALAGFYETIPVGHIEAGLRTWNKFSPFPEESNRSMISKISQYNFAPTEGNKKNLLQEQVDPASIVVTGNTVIDALYYILNRYPSCDFAEQFCRDGEKLILVTAHRRENFGEPIINICKALLEIVEQHRDVKIVYPVHLNSNIQNPVYSLLSGKERIHLLDPVNYLELSSLMSESYIVLTDSGGIQEEAPSLGKPVIVMRTETERPEAVDAGTVAVVGTNTEAIVNKTKKLLTEKKTYDKMAQAVNPYGDGKAAVRIADFLIRQK